METSSGFISFVKEYWGVITTAALSFLWLGSLETRIRIVEDKRKNDPVMTRAMCAIQHSADEKIDIVRKETFERQMSELREMIAQNDESLRDLIKTKHDDLILLIKGFKDDKERKSFS